MMTPTAPRALHSALQAVPLLALCCLWLLTAGCTPRTASLQTKDASMPSPYSAGRIVGPSGQEESDDSLARRLAAADYVLVGERHDAAIDHKVQAKIIELAARQSATPLLGLEMLPRNRFDPVLADFAAGRITLEALPSALSWRQSWGYDFSLYEPVFSAALRHRVPIYGLNIPNEVRMAASRNGLERLAPGHKTELPERIIPPLLAQREQLAEIFLAHAAMRQRGGLPSPEKTGTASAAAGGSIPAPAVPLAVPATRQGSPATVTLPVSTRGSFERFLLIQSLWDSTMAEQAVRLRKAARQADPDAGPMIILAGTGHVEYGYGIAARLAVLDPGTRICSIMPFSGQPQPGAADLFYHSPRSEARQGYGLTFVQNKSSIGIAAVKDGSIAARAGIMPGDILRKADGKPLLTLRDAHTAAMSARMQKKELTLLVERKGKQITVTLPEN